MRIAIARDVLKQIAAKKFKIETQIYWRINSTEIVVGKKQLLANGISCRVCAVGAAVISGIRIFNGSDVWKNNIANNFEAVIFSKGFSVNQLALIEAAFEDEGSQLIKPYPANSASDLKAAKKFRLSFTNEKERAIQIFQNIIDNKGKFKP
jgi:hypothetical protein